MTATELPGQVDLSGHGIDATGRIYRNPTRSLLYTHALARGEGRLAEGGPLVVDTGLHTGRSPQDKFVVREPTSEGRIWWGEVNRELSEQHFEGLREKIARRLGDASTLYIVDAWAGADEAHRIGVRVVTAHPYHALFAKTIFIDLADGERACIRAERPRPAHARSRGRPRGRRDPDRDVRRAAPDSDGGADRRHVLCR